jgi:menaquinone-9 beta-reductase
VCRVTIDADIVLGQLGIDVDVPATPVHFSKFVLPGGCLMLEQPNHFRVVRRDQFDGMLLRLASERGVVVRDGEALETIIRTSEEVVIKTSKNEYRSKILIGADGANSTVRHAIGLTREARLMIAMETFVPLSETSIPGFADNMAIFDVSVTSRGIPGYCWVFPTVPDGGRVVSLGIMAAPLLRNEALPLREMFNAWLIERGITPKNFDQAAHPILRYEPRARSSKDRIILAGDAAGIDPLFGEGITSALALGTIAAGCAFEALERSDFTFRGYEGHIRSSSIGRMMRRRRLLANRLYANPKLSRRYLQHGTLLKWIAMLKLRTVSGKLTWEAS